MAQEVKDSHFIEAGTINYPNGDNVVDATKTAVLKWEGYEQTLTFNAAGKPLAATNVTKTGG